MKHFFKKIVECISRQIKAIHLFLIREKELTNIETWLNSLTIASYFKRPRGLNSKMVFWSKKMDQNNKIPHYERKCIATRLGCNN